MAGRKPGGGRKGFVDTLIVMFLVIILTVVLVASGGWKTLSETLGIGDPNADLSSVLNPERTPLPHNTAKPENTLPHNTAKPDTVMPDNTAPSQQAQPKEDTSTSQPQTGTDADTVKYDTALKQLDSIRVAQPRQGGYDRQPQFGGWMPTGCGKATTRDMILARDLTDTVRNRECQVTSGVLADPYTGRPIRFKRGPSTSADVQIDHVVALQDAWASGARDWDQSKRVRYANSPDVLLASDGPANMAKGVGVDFNGTGRYRDGWNIMAPDIWLPDNQAYRCDYMAKRVAIKHDWGLSMTAREKQQTVTFLAACRTR